MPKKVEATFQAAIDALRAGRADDAFKHFQSVLELDPDNAPSLYNLVALHFQVGRSKQAEAHLKKAAALRPDHIDTRSVLAAVLVALKNLHDGTQEKGLATTYSSCGMMRST